MSAKFSNHLFSATAMAAIFFTAPPVSAVPSDRSGAPFFERQVAVYAEPGQLPGHNVVKYLPHAKISVIEVASGREWGLVQRLRDRGFRAGLNFRAEATAVPDDPIYSYQWHFPAVQAGEAWDRSTGIGVTVAVLDTGLVSGGRDGIGCVTPGYDIVNGDNDPADGDGHGTHVSGTIAQATNNEVGVAGLAPGACIMPVKVLDDGGSGSFVDIAEGIYWAVDNGAEVINMSLGINARFAVTNDPVMDPALDYAYRAGVTVVCASGNDGNRRNVSYPAIYPTTIAVGATDASNNVTRYSNKGVGLDLVAPGGDTSRDDNGDGYVDGVLQETTLDGGVNWGYYFFQGTSMASPHVAAIVALLKSFDATITPDDVLDLLGSTALDLGDLGHDSTSGWGLVQAFDALEAVDGGGGTDCTDADGDGWCVEDGDCDDTDASVNPSMNEKGKRRSDGLDNDCNGVIDG